MSQGRRGQRIVRYAVMVEDLLRVLSGGQRFEILRALADSPKTVTEIANILFLKLNAVSRDLAYLEELGLVVSERIKTSRRYQLSNCVRFFRRGEMLQAVIINPTGHWILLHFDETAAPHRSLVAPPDGFVDSNSSVGIATHSHEAAMDHVDRWPHVAP